MRQSNAFTRLLPCAAKFLLTSQHFYDVGETDQTQQLAQAPVRTSISLQSTYALKAIVLALSSFSQLLYLDSDSLAMYDPTIHFDSQHFHDTGAILWHDFWDADFAPDTPAVLGLEPHAMPQYTIESGQMVLDKSRCA